MSQIPTSSKMLLIVVKMLENTKGPPRFEDLQQSIKFASRHMPMLGGTGLTADSINLKEVIKQTTDGGWLFKVGGQYMLTASGRNVVSGIERHK